MNVSQATALKRIGVSYYLRELEDSAGWLSGRAMASLLSR
jgi:hypothetical protein